MRIRELYEAEAPSQEDLDWSVAKIKEVKADKASAAMKARWGSFG